MIEKKKILNTFLSICLHNSISRGDRVGPLDTAKDTNKCVNNRI